MCACDEKVLNELSLAYKTGLAVIRPRPSRAGDVYTVLLVVRTNHSMLRRIQFEPPGQLYPPQR